MDGVDNNDKKSSVSKSWCFTVNNYTEDDEKFFNDIELSYSVVGKEVGSDNNTPHLQGFIIFKRAYRLSQLKKLHSRAHWEPAKAADAGNYCMKDGNYVIRDYRSQGKRSDLIDYAEAIKTVGVKRAVSENPNMGLKYPGGTKFIQQCLLKHRRVAEPPTVLWYFGEAGTGKTLSVFEEYDEDEIYVKNCSKGNKWFDGYEQQRVCLFDDFRVDTLDWNFLLQITDRYPISVEIKGGMIPFNSPIIIFTSPRTIENTFVNNGEDIGQLLRRVTNQKYFCNRVTVTEVV